MNVSCDPPKPKPKLTPAVIAAVTRPALPFVVKRVPKPKRKEKRCDD